MGKEKDEKKDKKDKKDKDSGSDKDRDDKKDKKDKKDKDSKKDKKDKKKKDNKDKKHKDEAKSRAIAISSTPNKVDNSIQEKVKAARGAAGIAAEWGPIGQAIGLEIWRVEQFKLVPWPKNLYGQFYDGDSYIVLSTYQQAGGNKYLHNIHFWLGTNTSQDEAGTAAIKTVECDDLLGQEPVEYREVQGYESRQFLGYFPTGVTYLSGGVASGFTHVVAQQHKHRLLQLKGKKSIRVSQVALEATSLNEGDVFILDAGDKIYTWVGSKAGIFEKAKAGEVANALKQQTGGKGQTVTLEGKDRDLPEFFTILGGDADDVLSADEGGSDSESDKEHQSKKLFKLSDKSGSLEFTLVSENKDVKAKELKSEDVFILDCGYECFVWVGKKASEQEKKLALQYAQDYLSKNNKDAFPISRVMESGNDQAFQAAINL